MSARDLETALSASHIEPVILFKHSQTCGVSLMARELLADGSVPRPLHEIVVQRQRELSNAVASTLGVRHESPQVVVVARGAAVWHSSHSGVTPDRIARAWQDAAASFTATPAR
ncbi:MAG: bacillithiol system redox-active protein YtxJ [Acidobacteria bacterium]|nr:bacillithiol system redox-active protein YtxJ [Acidobacteriota bacterium]